MSQPKGKVPTHIKPKAFSREIWESKYFGYLYEKGDLEKCHQNSISLHILAR